LRLLAFFFEPVYEGPVLPSETDLEVTFSYPFEYARTDDANYQVEIIDGRELVRYSKRFHGGCGL